MPPPERPPFKIVPIERVDVYRSVLSQLERHLTASGFGRGDRLGSERELAEQFGVSRVVIREALRALESMGKIEIRRNSGSFVVDPHASPVSRWLQSEVAVSRPAPVQEMVDLRAAIETKVVQLVHRHGADLTVVEAVLAEAAEDIAAEGGDVASLDLRFEAALGELAGNPLLRELQRAVHAAWIELWTGQGLAPGAKCELHAQHEAILEALRARDEDRAVSLMATHIEQVTVRE